MMQRREKQDVSDDGFSLLEMVAVLTILALVAAVAWPATERSKSSIAMRRATIQLAAALKNARSAALLSNKETGLTLDFANFRFVGDGMVAANALPRSVRFSYSVPVVAQATDGAAMIRFRPDGSSSGGTIRLSIPRQSAKITVDWMTGSTKITWGG